MRIKTTTIFAAAMAAATLTTAHAADLHVRDFGAIPDDGKDDTDAVQKAVDAAQPGDTIHFDKGVYWFDNQGIKRLYDWFQYACGDIEHRTLTTTPTNRQ
jgi:opacity protein-like surface antigen